MALIAFCADVPLNTTQTNKLLRIQKYCTNQHLKFTQLMSWQSRWSWRTETVKIDCTVIANAERRTDSNLPGTATPGRVSSSEALGLGCQPATMCPCRSPSVSVSTLPVDLWMSLDYKLWPCLHQVSSSGQQSFLRRNTSLGPACT